MEEQSIQKTLTSPKTIDTLRRATLVSGVVSAVAFVAYKTLDWVLKTPEASS